jgi:acetylornithine/succinyldiaminopimelate/putrescine aminotransferase
MTALDLLASLREGAGPRRTDGLPDSVLLDYLADPDLETALREALDAQLPLRESGALAMAEDALVERYQFDYLNFYAIDAINPYVPIAARGPWVVTSHGAVVFDTGGYGMLGLGHAPQPVLDVLARPYVMANVMTASPSQERFAQRLKAEVGQARGGCPFDLFLCLNSGSEAMGVAARISDLNARRVTEPGARHAGKRIKFLGLEGAFHGRTDRPAQASHSSLPKYHQFLASFRGRDNLVTVPPNDIPALREAFAQADRDGVYFEAMLMEPVQGEGAPGRAMRPDFYAVARELTQANGTLLIVDSIQAGLRAWGVLSLVDYPGFEGLPAPDMETWSKAINAGQFPLSVLGMAQGSADAYVRGVYGNTMTTNPRALEVACAVLDALTPALRHNIVERGLDLKERLRMLQAEMPDVIVAVEGTGLLVAAELAPQFPVVGVGAIEERCRLRGLGVIHGGRNALRFTPHFAVTTEELALVVSVVADVLREARQQGA